ncbi:hypothetical protein QAD02_021286 [Eretmocerus hayati]|uniref:Uncharacterized protein n=1 Tax=Eretmocerus hayati TaxID=131215 RepID=A0ACC2PPU6_9HYME|nr:hypothetical protein QAD02_021286 [Eretmocerus hayati]
MSFVYCASCPKKGPINPIPAKHCTRCGVYYHKSCTKRAGPLADGSFKKCCGKKVSSSLASSDKITSVKNYTKDTQSDPKFEAESSQNVVLDLSLVSSSSSEVFLDSVDEIENMGTHSESADKEMSVAQLSRKNNVIVYNIPESDDKDHLKDYLNNMLRDAPFDPASLRYLRLGIKCNNDKTPQQQQYLSSLREKLEKRKQEGKPHLVLKYVKGIPTIYDPRIQLVKESNLSLLPQQLLPDDRVAGTSNSNNGARTKATLNSKKN